MSGAEPTRPALHPSISVVEFQRWYWLRAELQRFARQLGVPAVGSKMVLSQRISAALAGHVYAEPPSKERRPTRQLDGTLTDATVVPSGQRCSQHLRAWFDDQVGGGFRFDATMRQYIASAAGQHTLGEALRHWHDTRRAGTQDIDAQFEYNRFTRAWYAAHPDGDRAALLVAWKDYRSTPSDRRGHA